MMLASNALDCKSDRPCHNKRHKWLFSGLSPAKRKEKSAVETAVTAAKGLGATVQYVGKHELNLVSGNRPHQVPFPLVVFTSSVPSHSC